MLTQEIKTDTGLLQTLSQPAYAFDGIYESFLEQEKIDKQVTRDEERREHLLINNWWAN